MTNTSETQFVYTVDGEPYIGTVQDIAHALEQAHYAGLDVGSVCWAFPAGVPEPRRITTSSTDYDSDDYATVTVEIAGETSRDPYQATYRLDGDLGYRGNA